MIARTATAWAEDAAAAADELVSRLGGRDVRLVVAFLDGRLDGAVFAGQLQSGFGTAPTVGCTGHGVFGAEPVAPGDPPHEAGSRPAAVATAFYGDWLEVGVGVAAELPKSAIVRSRDAVYSGTAVLGLTPDNLDPKRHVAFTMVDGTSGYEDAFCIGSAAAAPQIRFVGGSASTSIGATARAFVWANGEALTDAGVVCVLDVDRRFEAITSHHMLATNQRAVVTAASGRIIDELDGIPAVQRMHQLVAQLGGQFEELQATSVTFARFVDGVPYVRSITHLEGNRIHLATSVDSGDVLHVMRPGDLVGKTAADLRNTADRLGGMEALLAFSCAGRHLEAASTGKSGALLDVFAQFPTTGFMSFGEQSGMVLVNHTLTGLAFGGLP